MLVEDYSATHLESRLRTA